MMILSSRSYPVQLLGYVQAHANPPHTPVHSPKACGRRIGSFVASGRDQALTVSSVQALQCKPRQGDSSDFLCFQY